VRDRIYFTVGVEDVRYAYAAMDALLFLSHVEPFGLVLAEAMASRVPVFGLAAEGGYAEPDYPLVTGSNSVFFERRNPHDETAPESTDVLDRLAREMCRFAQAPTMFNRMVDSAFQWVSSRFDGSRQSEAMLTVYDRLLNGAAPATAAMRQGALS